VAVSGNTVVAGAPSATVGGNAGQGAAYVFVKPASGWVSATETDKLTAADGAANDKLGWSAAADSGNTVVAGAPYAAVEGNPAAGAAYVFVFVAPPPPSPSAAVSALIDTVKELHLSSGIENSLVVKLEAARSNLAAANTKAACNNLGAFSNEVRAQSGKQIPASAAPPLITAASAIQGSLGCR
jgi:hypothetical protein